MIYIPSSPPLAVLVLISLFPCTAFYWILFVTSLTMTLFSANQLNVFISPHVRICTLLTEKTKYLCPQNLFCVFLAVPYGKDYTCLLYVKMFTIKHVFLQYAQSDWLQLLLAATT